MLAFAGTRTQDLMALGIRIAGFEIRDMAAWIYGSGFPKSLNLDGEWRGWGTALKPALEPVTLARKPLEGTVAENVQTHGTGALNIEGCRVGTEGGTAKANICKGEPNGDRAGTSMGKNISFRCNIAKLDAGRWPANLIHDGSEEVVRLFPGEGETSAARFFYVPKSSKKDRDGSNHPTMKPTDLMRYLCRLVTPPGGVVLDPFMGSGSTGKAAMLEGFRFIGIEREAEYVEIAQARIAAACVKVEDCEPNLFSEKELAPAG